MTTHRKPGELEPRRRALRVYAYDPMLGRRRKNQIVVDVAYESLRGGPSGQRVEVVDYDAARDQYYVPVDLDDPKVAMIQGLTPSEADPQFHQQMVYAVAMRVIENFDIALGGRFRFRAVGRRIGPLRLIPHAFEGRNAYYDPKLHAVLFGYYRTGANVAGPDYPGQTVFTCLSHDIIAHEVTHAIVHSLRPYFVEPSNPDVLAFHEGFADIVAIFQHFSFPSVLREAITESRGALRDSGPLVELAQEFGYTTGEGGALRSAVDRPDPRRLAREREPHRRGSILVAAVFEAFFEVCQRRTRDLVRIATDGRGVLPDGDLHPDLVNRIAREYAATAQSVLTTCIRAFDYLPPVDVTFGDYLRAIVTADAELSPDDEFELRASLIESFRRRGIYPVGVVSPSELSLMLTPADLPIGLDRRQVAEVIAETTARGDRRITPRDSMDPGERPTVAQRSAVQARLESAPDTDAGSDGADDVKLGDGARGEFRFALHRFAKSAVGAGVDALGLVAGAPIFVEGFSIAHRIGADGRIVVDVIARFVQTDRSDEAVEAAGGRPLRGGATVVFGSDGAVRYVVPRSLRAPGRAQRQRDTIAALEEGDPSLTWLTATQAAARRDENAFARLHLRRAP